MGRVMTSDGPVRFLLSPPQKEHKVFISESRSEVSSGAISHQGWSSRLAKWSNRPSRLGRAGKGATQVSRERRAIVKRFASKCGREPETQGKDSRIEMVTARVMREKNYCYSITSMHEGGDPSSPWPVPFNN